MNRITCFVPTLEGGGAERAALNLACGFAERGIAVDLVLGKKTGTYVPRIPSSVHVVDFGVVHIRQAILPLATYLRREKPDSLISFMSHTNVAAIFARSWARTKTRLVLVEQDTLSAMRIKTIRMRLTPPLMRMFYPRADAIVGVSQGVAVDLEKELGLSVGSVKVIHNPVVDAGLKREALEDPRHPWFADGGGPVVLGVGRFTEQKDFVTLIRAFATVTEKRPARLVILGDGPLRMKLQTVVKELKMEERVSLPGFVANPHAYMHRSACFVLSSRWEGLPSVLIEAMACGCPVVSTDCPSGPREILENGKWGELVPVGDVGAMAGAISTALDSRTDRALLSVRAEDFSVQRAVERYLEIMGEEGPSGGKG